MSLEGKDMFMLFMLFVCLLCFNLIFFSLSSPNIPCRFRESKTSKGRKSLILLHIFTFGDMSISNVVPSTHSIHVIPILVLLWFAALALFSRCFCVV